MARVTTEDCVTSIPNRFQLVIYACRRARDLSSGNEANVEINNDKDTVIALREIAEKKLDLMKIWEGVVTSTQKYQPCHTQHWTYYRCNLLSRNGLLCTSYCTINSNFTEN